MLRLVLINTINTKGIFSTSKHQLILRALFFNWLATLIAMLGVVSFIPIGCSLAVNSMLKCMCKNIDVLTTTFINFIYDKDHT